jgi:hypothetical protein
MNQNIAKLYASVYGVKQDWRVDWKENTRKDWRVDWKTNPTNEPGLQNIITVNGAPVTINGRNVVKT